MVRSLASALALGCVLSLTACGGDTCESVQAEIEKVGREIQQDPQKAMDEGTQEKLTSLKDKLEEMGCLQ